MNGTYIFEIVNRTIVPSATEELAVVNDNDSRCITFKIPSVIDGIDITDKILTVRYVNSLNRYDQFFCNTREVITEGNEQFVLFDWVLSADVTASKGTVTYDVSIYDTNDISNVSQYILHTKPATFEVDEGLLDVGAPIEDENTLQAAIDSFNAIAAKYYNDTLAASKAAQASADAAAKSAESLKVDATLTISGYAADAKTVGDKLAGKAESSEVTSIRKDLQSEIDRASDAESKLREDLVNIEEVFQNGQLIYDISDEQGGINSDGTLYDADEKTRRSSDFYDVRNIDNVTINERTNGTLYIAYYDESFKFIGRVSINSMSKLSFVGTYFKLYGYLSSGLDSSTFNSWFNITKKNQISNYITVQKYIDSVVTRSLGDIAMCEIGSISSTGKNTENSKRIRTKSYIFCSSKTKIIPNKGYEFWLFYYDDIGTLISQSDSYINTPLTISNDSYLRVIVKKITATEMSLEDAKNIYFVFDSPEKTQEYPHYFDWDINNKVKIINSNKLTVSSGFDFIFITDTHWEQNQGHSPSIIKEVSRQTGVGMVIHGGDYLNAQQDKAVFLKMLSEQVRLFDDSAKVYLPTYGNHEANLYDGSNIDKKFTYSSVFGDTQNKQGYFFIDNTQSKYRNTFGDYYYNCPNKNLRVIILNTSANGQVNSRHLQWLNDTIMSTPDGFSIFVACHTIWTKDKDTLSSDANILFDLFDAVNKKGSYKSDISDKVVSCDFSTKNVTVNLIICGHLHTDTSTTTTDGIPVIATTCDAYLSEKKAENTIGTYKEQAFDVVQVDTTARKIYTTRIGYGEDRQFTY